jgi:hypothetical protein
MPKTATKYLQNFLFHRHPQVTYLGKSEGPHQFCSPEMDQVVRCLRQPTHPGLRPYHDKCREILARIREPGKIMVFSNEAFTCGRRVLKQKQAELFGKFFGEFRVLLTIREPVSMMESLYLQELRGYHMNTAAYQRLVKRFGAPPRFFPIEEWLEANWSFPYHGAFSYLESADTVEAYAEVIGDQHILILTYEEMKRDNLAFVRRLSRQIGLDADESERLCKNRDTSKNFRWTQRQVERLKRFNSSLFLRWQYRLFKNTEQLGQFIGLKGPNLIVDAPRASVEFPPVWRERILQIGREQHTRLKARWDLPLEKFGYPVTGHSYDTHVESIRKAA